jgi:pimeloyl-ACP methyl ester carboxylesterase
MKRFAAAVTILLIALTAVVYFRPLAIFDAVAHVYLLARGFHSSYVRVGPNRVHTMTGGKGPPLLLIHGLATRGEDYALIMPALAKHHLLYVPDLLGFGATDRPNIAYSVSDEAEMIRGYLDAMHVERCDVMAASMGGWIALKFAADHPERVRRLVLVDSAGFPFPTTMTESTWTPSNAAEMRALIALQTDRVTWIPGFVMRDLLRQNRDHAWILRRAFRSMMTGRDLMQGRVQRVTMPVLLVWGMRDRIVPLAIGEKMQRELPNAKLVAFPGCGHLAVVECRDRVLPEVEKFLSSVIPTERSEWRDLLGACDAGPSTRCARSGMTRPSSALRAPSPRTRGEGELLVLPLAPREWGEGGRRPGEGRTPQP